MRGEAVCRKYALGGCLHPRIYTCIFLHTRIRHNRLRPPSTQQKLPSSIQTPTHAPKKNLYRSPYSTPLPARLCNPQTTMLNLAVLSRLRRRPLSCHGTYQTQPADA
ncbi:hypothetical protein M011DRAFT_466079 [Sporormia fimetaria CBS 119925]|uniref:Uncharacterized protein n=1 Tax=Sporormia fimetaria CBS 119925 TaxID=1340428 RepID=A0A6A6VIK6_9PLEO|nr:hypothetical protein M011DRAFT_466079 [Sporormia fimetaria CBS 119925]